MKLPRWHVCKTGAAVREAAAAWVATAAEDAIASRGLFRIVLAGGVTPRSLYEALPSLATDWSAWEVWFGDERCLSVDDPGRNSRMADDAVLRSVPIPPHQIHAIPGELGTDQAALDYRASLSGGPEFDLVLLGLGEDGHTASLFPGAEWGEGRDAPDTLAVRAAPKPPAERVSLSARRLSDSRCVLFLVAGAAKRAAVAAWRSGRDIPAAAICPRGGVDVLVEKICLEG